MTAEELKQLAPLVDGSVWQIGDKFDHITWKARPKAPDELFLECTDGEFPAECFDLLDRMEANGWMCKLDNHVKCYRADAWKQRDPGFSCAIHCDEFHVNGKTRTEAIVRLFLAVMK